MERKDDNDDAAARRLIEAAAWRIRLMELGCESSRDFEVWRTDDRRNEAAWRQIGHSWELFGQHAASPEMLKLRRRALDQARRASSIRIAREGWKSVRRFGLVAAALVAVVAGIFYWQAVQGEAYRTAAGERRVVTLSDGSSISLDASSEVRVRYDTAARELILRRGQARFTVARDVERPFSVLAGDQKVVATGTDFNIDLMDASVVVTLLEGRVVVLPRPQAALASKLGVVEEGPAGPRTASHRLGAGIELAAGEQLVATPTAASRVERTSIDRAIAWQSGRLVFENEPLSTVVARVNRYSARKLEIDDARVADLRISGVFNTGDSESFLGTITRYLPLKTQVKQDGTVAVLMR